MKLAPQKTLSRVQLSVIEFLGCIVHGSSAKRLQCHVTVPAERSTARAQCVDAGSTPILGSAKPLPLPRACSEDGLGMVGHRPAQSSASTPSEASPLQHNCPLPPQPFRRKSFREKQKHHQLWGYLPPFFSFPLPSSHTLIPLSSSLVLPLFAVL